MYHITQYAHCITAIKQTMIDRGRSHPAGSFVIAEFIILEQ